MGNADGSALRCNLRRRQERQSETASRTDGRFRLLRDLSGASAVVTESFSVQQDNGVSIVKSHLQDKLPIRPARAKIGPADDGQRRVGSLRWSDGQQFSGGNPQKRIPARSGSRPGLSSKTAEQPFLMPKHVRQFSIIISLFIAKCWLGATWQPTVTPIAYSKVPAGSVEFGVWCAGPHFDAGTHELAQGEGHDPGSSNAKFCGLNLKGENFSWALWVER